MLCCHWIQLIQLHGSLNKYSQEGLEASHKLHRQLFEHATFKEWSSRKRQDRHRQCRSNVSSTVSQRHDDTLAWTEHLPPENSRSCSSNCWSTACRRSTFSIACKQFFPAATTATTNRLRCRDRHLQIYQINWREILPLWRPTWTPLPRKML